MPTVRATSYSIVLGAILGLTVCVLTLGCGEDAFVEREEFRELAPAEDVALWTSQLERRGMPWTEVPDPPGTGPVVTAKYWLSRAAYAMEVRRRGGRFVVEIHGVDKQVLGGGWVAFGEGVITGSPDSFRGAVATFTWGCLGIRYRAASDGVGRLTFSDDGASVSAIYMAHEAPELWLKAYGVRADGERPAYAALRGQIPVTPALARLAPSKSYTFRVKVTDESGAPIGGALVQIKGKAHTRVVSAADGSATLAFTGADAPVAQIVSAGVMDHRNAERVFFADDLPSGTVRVRLPRLSLDDTPGYVWQNAAQDVDEDDAMACGTCHSWHYDEWVGSRHARMADNGQVHWERDRMLANDPEAPDDCRGCHQPAHAVSEPKGRYWPRGAAAGNHCDFCHKIHHVGDLRESGVQGSLSLLRPDPKSSDRPGAIHHVFGTLPDSAYPYMGAAYNPIFATSELCAGCHQGGGRWRDNGLAKVDTYEEWLRWITTRGSEDRPVQSCQDCHMPGATTRTEDGTLVDQIVWDGLHRDPSDMHSHRFLGTEPSFASKAIKLEVQKRVDMRKREWVVEVSLTNVGAGHKIPTGTWSKHVVVGVWAMQDGRWLAPTPESDRVRVTEFDAASNELAPGNWRNPAGMVLGVRTLKPSSRRPAFWWAFDAETLVDDRLAPGETRTATCRFPLGDPDKPPEVEVRVVHRRGDIGLGMANTPWPMKPYDAPPEVMWLRVVR